MAVFATVMGAGTTAAHADPLGVNFYSPADGQVFALGEQAYVYFACSGPFILCVGRDDQGNFVWPGTPLDTSVAGTHTLTAIAVDATFDPSISPQVMHTYFVDDGSAAAPDVDPPSVYGYSDPPANDNGWNQGPVVVHWHAYDNPPSSGAPSTPPDVAVSAEGVTPLTSDQSCDPAGNCANGSYTARIDSVDPTVACTTPVALLTNAQASGSVTATVTDALSGPQSSTVEVSVPTTQSGTYAVNVTGHDRAGRSTTVSCAYRVQYASNTILMTAPVAGHGPGALNAGTFELNQIVDAAFSCEGPDEDQSFCLGFQDSNLSGDPDYLVPLGTDLSGLPVGDFSSRINTSVAGPHSIPIRMIASDSSSFRTTLTLNYTVAPPPSTDTTPPFVMGTPDRVGCEADAPGGFCSNIVAPPVGWYQQPVTIDWTSVDPAPSSGSPTDPADTVAATEGEVTYTSAPSCDPGGNCATGSLSLKIDLTNPTVTCAAAPTFVAGQTDAVVRATVTDATSGPVSADLASPVFTGSAGTWSELVTGVDNAGLTSTVSCPFTVTADEEPGVPQTHTVPAGGTVSTDPEGDGATPADPTETAITTPVAGDVTITEGVTGTPPTGYTLIGPVVQITAPTATVADPLVLAFRLDASVPGLDPNLIVFRDGVPANACTAASQAIPDPCVVSRETLSDGDVRITVLSSHASQWMFAGNTDVTPPAVTGTPDRAPNGAGWYQSPVNIDWTSVDPAPNWGTPTDPSDTAAALEGTHSYTSGPSCDAAHNCSFASVSLSIDLTNPTVACAARPTFIIGQIGATITAAVSDSGSGPTATTVSAPATTAAAGTFSAVLVGTDRSGRTTSVSCSYGVTYNVAGFLQPIDNLPTINTATAGQTIPVKWRLTDANGAGISDPAAFVSITSSTTSCSDAAPTDDIETSAGASGLRYLGDGYWQFDWKTPKSYAGQCRTMRLNVLGGNSAIAGFRFR